MLFEVIRSALLWAGIASCAVFYGTLGFITTTLSIPFDKKRRLAHFWASSWARTVVALAWRCETDERRLPPNRPFVIAANHQSLADIIVCLHLRHPFKFLAKRSVFRVPFMGWFMYPAGYIPLKRGNRTSITDAMERSRRWLLRDVSVLFYPEGTRSPDGDIKPFKLGAFKLAIETGVDVLPVLLVSTADMLPKNSFFFSHKRSPMRLIVADPIPVAGLRVEDAPALAERTRNLLIGMKRAAEADAMAPPSAQQAAG